MIKEWIENFIYRINYKKYWRRRLAIQTSKTNMMRKYYFLMWLKRTESKFGATTGCGIGNSKSPCSYFSCPLRLPHGLSGIVIARNVRFMGGDCLSACNDSRI